MPKSPLPLGITKVVVEFDNYVLVSQTQEKADSSYYYVTIALTLNICFPCVI